MYPRKGTLQVGSDADVVIWDTSAERIISKGSLHDDLDYTPYEGKAVRGAVVRTILRGRTVFQRGAPNVCTPCISAQRGAGELIACGQPDLLGWGSSWPDPGDVVEQSATSILGPALDGVLDGVVLPSSLGKRDREPEEN